MSEKKFYDEGWNARVKGEPFDAAACDDWRTGWMDCERVDAAQRVEMTHEVPTVHKCEVCGDPMPEGETMFKFHGFSGPCPKPPLPRPRQVMMAYTFRDKGGKFWIDIEADRSHVTSIDFDTPTERDRAYDDLLTMMRSMGAQDMPSAKPQ